MVEPRSSLPDTHGQVCPFCRFPPSSVVERTVRGIVLADFLCPVDPTHVWFAKWRAVAA